MLSPKGLAVGFCMAVAIATTSCNSGDQASQTESPEAQDSPPAEVEKVKPTPGTGNVQGKVLYNSKPVEGIEVKLCEEFSQFVGGCDGKTYTAKTDKDGDFVITNVEPKTYQALLARVFNTESYIFATSGVGISSEEYEVTADKTLFAGSTNLFKGDLKVVSPKAGAKVSGQNLELKWETYPDAAYYKFSIYPDDVAVTASYIGERVDGTSFVLDTPLQKGVYRWQVEAYNSDEQKLSESSDEIKFTAN